MPRTFDGVDDRVTVSIGAMGFAFGPGTAAAIMRKTSNPAAIQPNVLSCGVTGASGWAFYNRSNANGNWLALWNGSAETNSGITLTASDGWALVALTKATGTSAVVGYKYIYSTGVFTSGGSATRANSTTPATSCFLGSNVDNSGPMPADFAVIAAWSAVLTSAQIQALAFSLPPWFAVAPKGLWIFDQDLASATVLDSSGNAANQSAITGTAITSSAPSGFGYFQPSFNNYLGVDAGSGMSVGEKIR